MKLLTKGIAVLAIIGATALFATQLSDIDKLVDQINQTKDTKMKTDLLNKLDEGLETIDKEQLPKARELINRKLQRPANSGN